MYRQFFTDITSGNVYSTSIRMRDDRAGNWVCQVVGIFVNAQTEIYFGLVTYPINVVSKKQATETNQKAPVFLFTSA